VAIHLDQISSANVVAYVRYFTSKTYVRILTNAIFAYR